MTDPAPVVERFLYALRDKASRVVTQNVRNMALGGYL